MWQHWVNFILGILLIILAYTGATVGALVVIGALVAILALWGGATMGTRTRGDINRTVMQH